MKKHLLKLSVVLAVGGIAFFTSMQTVSSRSAGGSSIAYCSGSPFDGSTCAVGGCHNGPPVAAPASWITSNVPKTGYIPGTTYTITCRAVNKTSNHNSNFGFEFTPQEQKTGNGGVLGTLTNITTSGKGATQVVTASPSAWVTHTSSSYTGTDSCVWSFKWKAPSPGIGAVNYYAAFNCGSGDNQSSGIIYWDSAHFIQGSTVGVEQVTDAATEVNIYPNPIKDAFNVSYSLQDSKQVEINVYSVDGKKIANLLSNTEQSAGDHNQQLYMPAVKSGIYLIQIIQGDQASYKKVIVE
ncbi:MAG TPA: choice-of-anchor V domain-containing protein [Bacteroidia bacterium]|jgi:hypothetical protein|nr:choice-of-anchor V domain-containing protein [Bacteroidia bacterium]